MAVKTVQAIVNGQTYTLSLNSGNGKYEGTFAAPGKSSYSQKGGYYAVTVKAVDEAGNQTQKDSTDAVLGAKLRLVVKEKVKPVISDIKPSENQIIKENIPKFSWSVADNDSGVNLNAIKFLLDGKDVSAEVNKGLVYDHFACDYTPKTPLTDGVHTAFVELKDNDGNTSTKTWSFTVDTVAPSLNVSKPEEELITNQPSCEIKGNVSDVTSKLGSVTVKLNAGAEITTAVGADGSFTETVTLENGKNTITIMATDRAGNTTVITRTVTLDTVPPAIADVIITPNPADAGANCTISVSVTD